MTVGALGSLMNSKPHLVLISGPIEINVEVKQRMKYLGTDVFTIYSYIFKIILDLRINRFTQRITDCGGK
jgi:hypothetical protein